VPFLISGWALTINPPDPHGKNHQLEAGQNVHLHRVVLFFGAE
jgi:hypothetical protein